MTPHNARRRLSTQGNRSELIGEKGWLFGVLALTAIVYWPVIGFDFVNFDDDVHVFDNPSVRTGLTLDNLVWAFGIHGPSQWHPLSWLSHQVDVSLFGVSGAGGHHLVNLAVHLANVVLVYLLTRRLTGRGEPALLVAAIFGIHPLNVESVAWVSERRNVLCLFFFLWAMIVYLDNVHRGKRPVSWSVIALYSLAGMAKPLAVTFPCVLLLIDVWPLRRLDLVSQSHKVRESLRAAIPLFVEKLPLFVISGICSWLTILCQQEVGVVSSFAAIPFSARITNALLAVLYYLRDAIWPAWLSVFYPHPALYGSPPGLLPDAWLATLSAAMILVATVAFWRLRARFPWLLVGWLWFLGTLVPMIGLFQVGLQQRADRYMYLPGLGLILGIAASLPWEKATFRTRHLPRIGVAIVITGFAVTASLQVGVWRSSQTLFEQALLVDPRNPVAHLNLGEALLATGQLPAAEEHLRAAIRFYPDYALAYYNLGVLQGQLGNTQAALENFETSISLDPGNGSAWVRRGGLLGQAGQFDLAKQNFQQALAIDPHDLHARFNLGLIDEMQGNWKNAREAYLAVLQQDPTFSLAARQLEQLNERHSLSKQ